MKKHIYDESNGLSYTLHGDYYLPDLAVNEGEPTYGVIRQIKRCRFHQIKTGLSEHLTMG